MGDRKRQRSIEWQQSKIEFLQRLAFLETMKRLGEASKPVPMVQEPDGMIHQDGDAKPEGGNNGHVN